MNTSPLLQLHPADNVAIARRDLAPGERASCGDQEFVIDQRVPQGHKIAIAPIRADAFVVKFGQPIGFASRMIQPGAWVHSHNLEQRAWNHEPEKCTAIPPPPEPLSEFTFQGYRRASGRAGTRNYVAVISNVNCSATAARNIAQYFTPERLAEFPHVDGVLAIRHTSGCGMQFGGLKHDMLNRTLAGMANHPNIGAYLLLGLGCEQASLGHLVDSQRLYQIQGVTNSAQLPPMLSLQDAGGTRRTIEAGIALVKELLPQANAAQRETIPASELILGTNCGGSDGHSGVTCNPALGIASDLLVAAGGTTVLAETTEVYGAEQLLTRRATSPAVADHLLNQIEWWLRHAAHYGVELDCNPSVGNKAGGLTTIAEKSLGAVSKAGSSALRAVYEYAEPIRERGFVFMDTPGFDPVSVTGLVAGGCNLIAFTTGRGSCFGCKPVPSLKIASNTPMFERLRDDMDINAGEILNGQSVADVGQTIFHELLAVASGKKTNSELHGYGDKEFVPWQVGPVL